MTLNHEAHSHTIEKTKYLATKGYNRKTQEKPQPQGTKDHNRKSIHILVS